MSQRRRLRQEIGAALVEFAWCGARIDEATHLVQTYCFAAVNATFDVPIGAIVFAPSIERVFALLDDSIVVELPDDLVVVRSIRMRIDRSVDYHPIWRCLVTVWPDESIRTPRYGKRLNRDVFVLDWLVECHAIDASNGDLFLWYRTELVLLDPSMQTKQLRIKRGGLVFTMFADAGLLLLDHSLGVSIYDVVRGCVTHQFQTNSSIVHFDARRKRIYTTKRQTLTVVDFDGHLVDSTEFADSWRWTFARLSDDRFVDAHFLNRRCTVELVEQVS